MTIVSKCKDEFYSVKIKWIWIHQVIFRGSDPEFFSDPLFFFEGQFQIRVKPTLIRNPALKHNTL